MAQDTAAQQRKRRRVVVIIIVAALLLLCLCFSLLLVLNNRHAFSFIQILPEPSSPAEVPTDKPGGKYSPKTGQGIDEANPPRCEIKEVSRTCSSCNTATVVYQLANCQTEEKTETDANCANLCPPPPSYTPPPTPPAPQPNPQPDPPILTQPGTN